MKKILLVVLVAISTTGFAINPLDYEVFYKLNNKSTFNSLVRYLDTDYTQTNQLEYVFSVTENNLKSASKTGNESAAQKAVYFNLGNVKNILSQDQYRKYLTLLNLSIINRYNETMLASEK